LNNTSIGTTADDQGRFEFYVPAGRYDLVVSSVGFETYIKNLTPSELPELLTVELKYKSDEMEAVVIEPYDKNGWDNWGRFFLDNFIGNSYEGRNCTIRNTGVIRFRNSKKTNTLVVTASEPLIIENKALGYIIRYQLELFRYDFNTGYLVYAGYPYFIPMQGGEAKQRKWEKNRREVYEGSMLHFMRSVYRNNLTEEGFELHALKKIANEEKLRVKIASKANMKTESKDGQLVVSQINEDSARYYQKVLRQPNGTDLVGKEILSGDSIAYAIDSLTAGLAFDNYLLVSYKNKKAPREYYLNRIPPPGDAMVSQITLINGRPIAIQSNGSYYNPTDLLSLGYWAWSEKLGRMLPFDYKLMSNQRQ
jgi:CarboxypepD_reg-like domain